MFSTGCRYISAMFTVSTVRCVRECCVRWSSDVLYSAPPHAKCRLLAFIPTLTYIRSRSASIFTVSTGLSVQLGHTQVVQHNDLVDMTSMVSTVGEYDTWYMISFTCFHVVYRLSLPYSGCAMFTTVGEYMIRSHATHVHSSCQHMIAFLFTCFACSQSLQVHSHATQAHSTVARMLRMLAGKINKYILRYSLHGILCAFTNILQTT